jgi:hypothetical protein
MPYTAEIGRAKPILLSIPPRSIGLHGRLPRPLDRSVDHRTAQTAECALCSFQLASYCAASLVSAITRRFSAFFSSAGLIHDHDFQDFVVRDGMLRIDQRLNASVRDKILRAVFRRALGLVQDYLRLHAAFVSVNEYFRDGLGCKTGGLHVVRFLRRFQGFDTSLGRTAVGAEVNRDVVGVVTPTLLRDIAPRNGDEEPREPLKDPWVGSGIPKISTRDLFSNNAKIYSVLRTSFRKRFRKWRKPPLVKS